MARTKIYPNFPDDDPIARLLVHYFYPCERLFDDYRRAKAGRNRKGERTREMDISEMSYLSLWLASLFAVLEGFRELEIESSKIDALSAEHWDSLRLLRNGTFHFQPVHNKQSQFFTGNVSRIEWAKNVHSALKQYFSDYTVEFMVRTFMSEDR